MQKNFFKIPILSTRKLKFSIYQVLVVHDFMYTIHDLLHSIHNLVYTIHEIMYTILDGIDKGIVIVQFNPILNNINYDCNQVNFNPLY